jgi:hypothetical protein
MMFATRQTMAAADSSSIGHRGFLEAATLP